MAILRTDVSLRYEELTVILCRPLDTCVRVVTTWAPAGYFLHPHSNRPLGSRQTPWQHKYKERSQITSFSVKLCTKSLDL